MGKYTIMGKSFSLDNAHEKYIDYQHSCWDAQGRAQKAFELWYKGQRNIEAVLKGYQEKSLKLVEQYSIDLLFPELAEYEIYDISRETYNNICLDTDSINEAYRYVRVACNSIDDEKEAEIAYRAERMDSRDRVVGGGFGLEGAVKGMATAGAINAATGLGHGLFNAVGNLGSSLAAFNAKSDLYDDKATIYTLSQGITSALLTAYNNHSSLMQDKSSNYDINGAGFDKDKSNAYLENAKNIPHKSEELLLKAISTCPWNYNVYQYIFSSYADERKDIYSLSKRFHVDLSEDVEKELSGFYTEEASTNEEKAQEAKSKITHLMAMWGVEESATLNKL